MFALSLVLALQFLPFVVGADPIEGDGRVCRCTQKIDSKSEVRYAYTEGTSTAVATLYTGGRPNGTPWKVDTSELPCKESVVCE